MLGLLLTIVLIVVFCAAAVWIIGQVAPGHPVILDKLIWIFCVVVVGLVLLSAFGLADVAVPRLRH